MENCAANKLRDRSNLPVTEVLVFRILTSMQQPAITNSKLSTALSPINMTTLIRQPLTRVHSESQSQYGTAQNNGAIYDKQPANVQVALCKTVQSTEVGQSQSVLSNQSRVTTLILPSRSAANTNGNANVNGNGNTQATAQRAAGSQKQNLVTVTRMHSTPAMPVGSTQILYNASLAALNFAPGYVHNTQPQMQSQHQPQPQSQLQSQPQSQAQSQLLLTPLSRRFSNRSFASSASLATVQSAVATVTADQPANHTVSSSPPIQNSIALQESQLQQANITVEAGSTVKVPSTDNTEEPKPTPVSKDDGLTNLNWLQNPNLVRLSSTPPPPLSPPPTPTPSRVRFGSANTSANASMSECGSLVDLTTPPRSASGDSHSQLASPISSPNFARFARFASQQIAALAPFDADTDVDTQERQLARIAGEVERRDTAAPIMASVNGKLVRNSASLHYSSEPTVVPAFSQFTPTVGQSYAVFGRYGAQSAAPGYQIGVNGAATSRLNRQRSAPYGNPPRRLNSRPRARASRKSQQHATTPTINPRFALAAGYRPQRAFSMSYDPLLSATGVDPRSMSQSHVPVHHEVLLTSGTELASCMRNGQSDVANPLNDEELAEFLRTFENDENNMDFGDDSEGVVSSDLDLTVHGVGLKAADLINLSGSDSFDRFFGLGPSNPSAFVPTMPPGQSVAAQHATTRILPNISLGSANNLNMAASFVDASMSAPASAVIDLMNPDELCFNDERTAEQSDSDLFESFGDFALDSILGHQPAS